MTALPFAILPYDPSTTLSRLIHQLPPILKELQEEQQQEKVNPNLFPPYMTAQAFLVSQLAQAQAQAQAQAVLVSQLSQLVADLRLVEQGDSWQLELAAVGKALAR